MGWSCVHVTVTSSVNVAIHRTGHTYYVPAGFLYLFTEAFLVWPKSLRIITIICSRMQLENTNKVMTCQERMWRPTCCRPSITRWSGQMTYSSGSACSVLFVTAQVRVTVTQAYYVWLVNMSNTTQRSRSVHHIWHLYSSLLWRYSSITFSYQVEINVTQGLQTPQCDVW